MSGDKGRLIINENISKTTKTKTMKIKPQKPPKFQKMNKNAENKLAGQNLKGL